MALLLHSVISLPSFLWETITKSDPTWLDLATITAAAGIFWEIFIFVGIRLIRPLVAGKPWLVRVATREFHRRAKKNQGIDTSHLEGFLKHYIENWPWLMLTLTQHFVGAVLCIPALGNFLPGSPELASSLACLGILSEVGWEIADLIFWTYQRRKSENTSQGPSLCNLVLHHCLATCLGLPMVMYYRESKVLHWLCFDLQLATAACGFITEYTKFLDVSKPSQMIQFQLLSFVLLLVLVVTRGLHYVYLSLQVLTWIYAAQKWALLAFAGLVAMLYYCFSICAVIIPSYKKFVKFYKISSSHQNLAAGLTPKKQQNTLKSLESAASDMRTGFREEIVLALFKEQSSKQTLPAPTSSTTDSTCGVIARFSMNDLTSKQRKASFVARLEILKEE